MAKKELTPERIWKLGLGFAPPLILEAAVRNGVFDILEGGAKTLEEVASETGASPRGVRALLNALVALEFLSKKGEAYALTPESSAFLVSTKPDFQGGIFRHLSRQMLPTWLGLSESVRSGKPVTAVNQEGEGAEFFREFVEDLFPRAYPGARVLADAMGVATATGEVKVLDIAAGSGVWSIAFAERSPHVRVTVVDWAPVIPVARSVAEQRGFSDRYSFVEGDLLEADFGSGHHVATLGHIVHSEGEARSRELFRKVFAALSPGGTIAIAEWVPNEERTGPPPAMIFAVNMLVHTDFGDVFTLREMSEWLEAAGFAQIRELEIPGPSPLILATKPG